MYVDCVCGSISSIISLSAVIFVAVTEGIKPNPFFRIALSFWILWLILSITIVGIGLHLYLLEKNYDKWKKKQQKRKKKLEPPIL
ncbi:MAG: hypothetical protein ACFE9Q_12590 [Candidatus Hodarchaeota archaeon]